jgi:hypothetical protein
MLTAAPDGVLMHRFLLGTKGVQDRPGVTGQRLGSTLHWQMAHHEIEKGQMEKEIKTEGRMERHRGWGERG